jgi:hypothetical protein
MNRIRRKNGGSISSSCSYTFEPERRLYRARISSAEPLGIVANLLNERDINTLAHSFETLAVDTSAQ